MFVLKSNISYYFFSNIINFFSSFLAILILTNYITPKEFGIFSFAQSIFFIGYSLSFSNYYFYLNKKITEDNVNRSKYIANCFYLNFFVSFLIFVITAFLFSKFVSFNELKIILIINLQLILLPTTILYYDFFLAKKFYFLLKIGFFVNLTSLIIKTYFIISGFDLNWIASSFLSDVILNSILINLIYFKKKNFKKFTIKIRDIFSLLKLIIFYPIIGFLGILAIRVDTIMVKILTGYENTAIYSVASRVILIIISFFILILKFFYPILTKNYNNIKIKNNLIINLSRIFFTISFFIFLFIYFFSFEILSIFGSFYANGSGPLITLSLNLFIIFLLELLINLNYIEMKLINIIKISFTYIILNLVLNYFLIKLYNIDGAAMATIIAGLLCLVFFTKDIQKKTFFINEIIKIHKIKDSVIFLKKFI